MEGWEKDPAGEQPLAPTVQPHAAQSPPTGGIPPGEGGLSPFGRAAIAAAVVLGVVMAILLVLGGRSLLSDRIDEFTGRAQFEEELNNAQGTAGLDPGEGIGPNRPDRPGFEELRCVFSGTAVLDPGIPLGPPSPQAMKLEPGSRFECDRPQGETSGAISMQVLYPQLGTSSGKGQGTGSIAWEQLEPDVAAEHPLPASSTVDNEIELRFPVIDVWVTITDGPYAEHRGHLELFDWEIVQEAGRIVEIVFHPTEVVMSPL